MAVALAASLACDGGRDRLLADLQSPHPEARAAAVKKLGGKARGEDLVLFTRAAKDPAAIVRAEAVVALGNSPDARVVDLLGELLGDPDEAVQTKAAMALAQIRNDKAKAYLTSQYGRRSRRTRAAIVQALQAANVPGAMASVVAAEAQSLWDRNLKALTLGALPEKVAAAEELGKSGRAEAVNRLLPLTKDSQVILAAAAVRGLAYAGDRRAVASIASLLRENFPELREAACEALHRLQDANALPALKEVAVEKSAASPLATAAVIALPRGAETDKALCEIALEANAPDALAAAREMRKRGGCPLAPLVERLARGQGTSGALAALQGLGQTAKEALPKVLPLLAASDAATRLAALSAVAEIGDPSAGEAVAKAFDQELKAVTQLRADWVGDLPKEFAAGFGTSEVSAATPTRGAGGRSKLDNLLDKVRVLNDARTEAAGMEPLKRRPPAELVDDAADDQLRVFAVALRALGRVGAPKALETLSGYREDPSAEVRAAAVAGLASLGEAGTKLARDGLFDDAREVQVAAAQALAEAGEGGQKVLWEALPKIPGDKVRMLEALDRQGAGTAQVVPTLTQLLEGGGGEAHVAARLLGTARAKEAVDPLLRHLDHQSGGARTEALWALGRIGDARAAEVIAKDLYHDNPEVRAAAAEAVSQLGGASQAEALDALKGDYYRTVREMAQLAHGRVSATAEQRK